MSSKRNTFFSPFTESPFFTKNQLKAYAIKFAMPKSTLDSYIHKALRDTQIISFKRNCYVTRTFYEKHKTDMSYLFFTANKLIQPSYVSLESALQYHNLLAEAVNFTVTSVAQKSPRVFMNRTGRYTYRKISETLFTGFTHIKGNFEFYMALPHKAVFDYIYYHTNRFTKNLHPDLMEYMRIDTDSLSAEEKDALKILISKFTSIKMNI